MTITIDTGGGGPLKREIVEMAFGNLAMAGYEFGRTPEEVADALSRLNGLMLEWPYDQLGYQQSLYGVGSGEEASGIDRKWIRAVAGALTLDLAGMMGAQLGKDAAASINTAILRLQSGVATVPLMPYSSGTVAGAGNRSGRTFLRSYSAEEAPTDDPGDLAGLIP